ncbi:hypothetical protein LEP1GSC036_1349 [Leptospira weilii str. 2006001853]|uniref:Uncharacterized protein n=2 Tax=Leptospira weilii TaxID=28184 RepID=A0A828Z4W0_9LEPT|nr:hypothetical protein LEP1GSC036_1349 [Leptospira weilii str. 2006001853]EMN43262.1 hypothetical protein LEP1GSC086_0435 [Leptospira weilii str. LNT 1234]EMY12101.1 hypothetical protein LEP1GSC043_3504 [Leptospira weilii str. Ecochallenge]
MKTLSLKESTKLLNSNSDYIILLIVLKKLKSLSSKPFFFTTMFGFINI